MNITFTRGLIKKILEDKIREDVGVNVDVNFENISVELVEDSVVLTVLGGCKIKKEDVSKLRI